ncbi:MAG: preprotein translocase subunit SecA, partial [Parasphingorhabdus sp.]
PVSKREAYKSDIVYGTNNEYGFDYLRDNMAFSAEDRAQGKLNFAIVDEVDSILIDEARTPLIISGPSEESTDLYMKMDALIPSLSRQEEEDGPGDYHVDEKTKQVFFTEEGNENAEDLLLKAGLLEEGASLYDVRSITLVHHLNAALRGHVLFQRDVDYIVRDDRVVIIDEFTGRMMEGRRWSEGLHQAVEAKEGVSIQQENQTLASITFQNFFRLYDKLSGMTGTADTEASEFQQIYSLEVAIIPTHRDMIRDDQPDLVYRTTAEKFNAIVEGIEDCVSRKQPVLVGTASIETSEQLSAVLKKSGVPHQVLNAKHHESEAQIIAEAGRPGAVTIATNMAGRGTDIVLGGNLESELAAVDDSQQVEVNKAWEGRHKQVLESGGLHVLGTERNESRRVDNQLRGRSGRQGDPGSSRFYLSMEDSLMRIFGSERVAGLMQKLGMEEGEAIEHPWVTRAIENSQKKVEGRNFDIRKQLLEYDDVANEQRKVVYRQRDDLMEIEDISDHISSMREEVVGSVIDDYLPPQSIEEQWDIPELENAVESTFGIRLPVGDWLKEDEGLHEETLRKKIGQAVDEAYNNKEQSVGPDAMRHLEKAVMLRVLDDQWKEHLAHMDHLRQGIGLRGYAQKNPKQEYKRESFEMFTDMLARVRHDVVNVLSRIQIQSEEQVANMEAQRKEQPELEYVHADAPTDDTASSQNSPPEMTMRRPAESVQTFVRDGRKVGRNEVCPCGSGKKFKQCHGRL